MEIHKSIGSTYRCNGSSIKEALKSWLNTQHSHNLKALLLMVALGIWIARNHALFDDKITLAQLCATQSLAIILAFPHRSKTNHYESQ
jgi:hypothetical protein